MSTEPAQTMHSVPTPRDYERISTLDITSESKERLGMMNRGGEEMLSVLEEAHETGYHVLASVVNADPETTFTQWNHYPPGDVNDRENGALWFYHAHDEDKTARPWDEHGHFHLFIYTEHMPDGVKPVALPSEPDWELGGLVHLAAVSFSQEGLPIRVFTTNRWVADEWMYKAEDLIPMLDRFVVETEKFSLTSRWLMALLKLYRPQLEWALQSRDRMITTLQNAGIEDWSEDDRYEVLSAVDFDLAAQIDAVEQAIASKS